MKNRNSIRLTILIVAMATIIVVSYRRTHPPQNAITGEPGSSDLVLQVRSVPITDSMDLGTFVVPANSSHEAKIIVDESRMRNARLAGRFSTGGGPGIEVLVLDEDQYVNFQKKLTPSDVLYMSKTTADGIIEANVPHGGTYHLVFDNSHSESTANVKADVTLRYETVRVDSSRDRKK